MTSFFLAINSSMSKPSEWTLAARSFSRSSKLMNTPVSPNLLAPLTRNVIPNRVLPHPAEPQSSVGRPVGRPPSVRSSKPPMPVGVFGRCTDGRRMRRGREVPYDLALDDLLKLRSRPIFWPSNDCLDAPETPEAPKRSFSAVSRKLVKVRFSSFAHIRAVASNSGSSLIGDRLFHSESAAKP